MCNSIRSVSAALFAAALTIAVAPGLAARADDDASRAAAGQFIDGLVREALARSPSLAVLREKAGAARESAAAADARPGLMTDVMFTDVGFPKYTVGDEEMSMVGVEFRQGLVPRDKRRARRRAADGEVQLRDAEAETLRRQLARDVRLLCARLYAVDQELALLGPGREMLDLLEATTTTRYSAGLGGQEAVLKVQLLVVRLGERETDLRAERRRIAAGLGRLVDRPVGPPPLAALPAVAFPPAPWDDAVLAASADVAERRTAVSAAERRVESARAEQRPDYSVGGAASLRGALDPVVTLRFGVEWPGGGRARQMARIGAADRELAQAQAELRVAQAGVQETARTLLADKEQAAEQFKRLQDGVLPLSTSAFDAARSSYLAGRGEFSALVENFNEWLAARTELGRREADLFGVWAQLQALIAPALEGGAQ